MAYKAPQTDPISIQLGNFAMAAILDWRYERHNERLTWYKIIPPSLVVVTHEGNWPSKNGLWINERWEEIMQVWKRVGDICNDDMQITKNGCTIKHFFKGDYKKKFFAAYYTDEFKANGANALRWCVWYALQEFCLEWVKEELGVPTEQLFLTHLQLKKEKGTKSGYNFTT